MERAERTREVGAVVRAGFALHHLAWCSPQPDRVAAFYADALDMTQARLGAQRLLCAGPDRRLLIDLGPARGLRFAAYVCPSRELLVAFRAQVTARGVTTVDHVSELLPQSSFAIHDPEGRVLVFGAAAPGSEQPAAAAPGARVQHVVFATRALAPLVRFYVDVLGFAIADRVVAADGSVRTIFLRSSPEHHSLAFFLSAEPSVDHHSYEVGDWNAIRDWCDRFAARRIPIVWGPGRHGPGNNLFAFIADPDGNRIELSAELELVDGRPPRDWPHEERSLNLWGRGIMRS